MRPLLLGLLTSSLVPASLMTDTNCNASGGAFQRDPSVSICVGDGIRAEARARAEYGSLQTFVGATPIPPFTFASRAIGIATARFDDLITILGAGSGNVRVNMQFGLGGIDSTGAASFRLGTVTRNVSSMGPMSPFPIPPFLIPIEFGVPIPISGFLGHSGVASATERTAASFSLFTSFELLDQNGAALDGFLYESQGEYRFAGGTHVTIPEPATGALVILALLFGFMKHAPSFRYAMTAPGSETLIPVGRSSCQLAFTRTGKLQAQLREWM